jgi:uncharacterized protein (DUF2267 family)
MDQDDLLARIQQDGRLYGRNETRRAIGAVLTSLSELLPAPAYRRLFSALPADLRRPLPRPGAGRIVPVTSSRSFVARVAERLYVDGPNAAFLARVVLTRLNTAGSACAPAALAPLVPADLRPLLRAGAPDAPVTRRAVVANQCRSVPVTLRRAQRRARPSIT